MEQIQIYNETSSEERNYLIQQLTKFNHTKVKGPFKEEDPVLYFSKCMKIDNEVIGGILANMYWRVLYIDILWVDEKYRNKGYASALLSDIERMAKEKEGTISHLSTHDFQAKVFYEKLGYKVFGILEDCPEGHNCYYMSKKLV
jgi:ribosomal protein S18 acetylase RimI-like enzyme